MIKVKDGYAKLIGTTYLGSSTNVLLSNGGNFPIHSNRNNEANKLVRTDSNGFLQTGWINTTSGDMGTGTITKIYCSNDDYIRYKTPANFFSSLTNSGNNISITVAGLNRTLQVGYASNSDKLDGIQLLQAGSTSGVMRSWRRGTFTTVNQYFGNGAVVVIDPAPTDSSELWANTSIFSIGDLNTRNWQMAFCYYLDVIKVRRIWDGPTYGNWKTLAFLDSTVTSATKLATSRTLWGLSFNGTANVSGNILNTLSIKSISGRYLDLYGSSGIAFYTNDSVKAVVSSSGNFGIGTTSPSYKLLVEGTFKATSSTVSNLFINTGDATLKLYSGLIKDALSDGNICLQTSIDGTDGQTHSYPTQYLNRCNLVLQPRGGQVYIGTNPSPGNTAYKLYVNGKIFSSEGFVKSGSSDSYVLLGGGGHKTIDSFLTNYDGRYVKKSGDTMTGTLTTRSRVYAQLSGRTDKVGLFHSSTSNKGGIVLADTNGTEHVLYLTTSNLQWKGRTVWDSGNGGSGSGLDADLLDGTHKSGLFTALSSSSSTNLSITIGGTTKTIADLYATLAVNADKLDNLQATSFMRCDGTNSIGLSGGNGKTAGWRLVMEKTCGGWTICNIVFSVTSRHTGQGVMNIGFHTTNEEGTTYIASINLFGSTASNTSSPWRAFYNTSTKKFRLYWYYSDYNSAQINVLSRSGFNAPTNGTWYEAMPSDNGTELTIYYNNAQTATLLLNSRKINGTSFNGTSDITTSAWGTTRTISLTGAVTGSVLTNGSGNITINTTYGTGNITNLDSRYVRAFGTSNDNIDSDWGLSFKTFDPIPSGTPPELNPNISILNIGNNFNRRKLLAFTYNNDNIYYRRHVDNYFTNWRRLAFANEIPTSLKNPHALTISLNGTSQGPYDGSAAKNINITPSSIGAATSGHNHDDRYLKLTGGTMTGNLSFSDTGTSSYPIESKGISWSGGTDGASIFYRLLASDLGNLVFRTTDDSNCYFIWENKSGSTTSQWMTLKGSSLTVGTLNGNLNWSYILNKPTTISGYGITNAYTKTETDSRYVNVTGDTMSGNLSFNAGKLAAWSAKGTSYITNGNVDTGTSLGGDLANLVISSWNGVSFTTSCSGLTYTGKTAVGINCRKGIIYAATFTGPLQGNASSATKLATARTINGTSFDGTANITTAKWGTARTIYIQDASGAHGSVGVSVDGSTNYNLKLPSTITATLSGNASTATNADKLDGLHSTHYFRKYNRSDMGSSMNLNTLKTFGIFEVRTSEITTTNSPMSGYYPLLNFVNGEHVLIQIAGTTGNLFYRATQTANVGTSAEFTHSWAAFIDNTNYTSYIKKIGTSTVGGTDRPIYLSSGTPTPISSTKGSATLPVYLNAGTITACTPSSVFSNLSNSGTKLSISVAGQNRTLTVMYATSTLYVVSSGRQTALSGTTAANSGIRLYEAYNNGYPISYGNLLSMKGLGSTELLMGWKSGANRMYYRSNSDINEGWTGWSTVATLADVSNAVKTGTTEHLAYYSSTSSVSSYNNSIGNSYTPIYLSSGVPKACNGVIFKSIGKYLFTYTNSATNPGTGSYTYTQSGYNYPNIIKVSVNTTGSITIEFNRSIMNAIIGGNGVGSILSPDGNRYGGYISIGFKSGDTSVDVITKNESGRLTVSFYLYVMEF